MRERETRRIAEAIRRAVNNLSDHRQRLHGAGADARRQQQFGEIDRGTLGCRGQRSVQATYEHITRPQVVMLGHHEMR